MGEVYEAEDRLLQGVHVALKPFFRMLPTNRRCKSDFEREVLLARETVHPNLCPIYDIFHSDQPAPNFLFLTMKLLPGETLAARLRRTDPHLARGRTGDPEADGLGTGRNPRVWNRSSGY